MQRYEIVGAFVRERYARTAGTDVLRPAGPRPLTILRHTHDWRGTTWFDEQQDVVWLCSTHGHHRSRESDDSFLYFLALRDEGLIWPTGEDYEDLAADRGTQFAAFVVDLAPDLLAEARANPGVECSRTIGREPIAIVVEIVETLEETYVAVSGLTITPPLLNVLLASLYPNRSFEDWRFEDRLPTRDLDVQRAEFCLSILH